MLKGILLSLVSTAVPLPNKIRFANDVFFDVLFPKVREAAISYSSKGSIDLWIA